MKLLTQKELAEILQLSRATISRMCAAGDLPHYVLRSGRRKRVIRFRLEEIEKWLAQRTHTGPGGERPKRNSARNGNELATAKTMMLQVHEAERENGQGHEHVRPVPEA